MAAKNDITGDTIATRATTQAFVDGHSRIFSERVRKNPLDHDDANPLDLVCSVCTKRFKGNGNRSKCALCQ